MAPSYKNAAAGPAAARRILSRVYMNWELQPRSPAHCYMLHTTPGAISCQTSECWGSCYSPARVVAVEKSHSIRSSGMWGPSRLFILRPPKQCATHMSRASGFHVLRAVIPNGGRAFPYSMGVLYGSLSNMGGMHACKTIHAGTRNS